ncbi:16591_t:CDS:2, partial [Funneliformis mosseae]
MEDIMKLINDSNVYSNPKSSFSLLFPFLGKRKPVERFAIDNDNVYIDCFIYETIGYEESFILATITCFLLRTGKCVVFLPDYRELANNPEISL